MNPDRCGRIAPCRLRRGEGMTGTESGCQNSRQQGLEASTCVHLVYPRRTASDPLTFLSAIVHRSLPASRSFVLASLRALHLDPGFSSARARTQEGQGESLPESPRRGRDCRLTSPLLWPAQPSRAKGPLQRAIAHHSDRSTAMHRPVPAGRDPLDRLHSFTGEWLPAD